MRLASVNLACFSREIVSSHVATLLVSICCILSSPGPLLEPGDVSIAFFRLWPRNQATVSLPNSEERGIMGQANDVDRNVGEGELCANES